jgi:hypothetical protein
MFGCKSLLVPFIRRGISTADHHCTLAGVALQPISIPNPVGPCPLMDFVLSTAISRSAPLEYAMAKHRAMAVRDASTESTLDPAPQRQGHLEGVGKCRVAVQDSNRIPLVIHPHFSKKFANTIPSRMTSPLNVRVRNCTVQRQCSHKVGVFLCDCTSPAFRASFASGVLRRSGNRAPRRRPSRNRVRPTGV